MAKKIFLFMVIIGLMACSNTAPDKNENLPNVPVNVSLSLNSPQYQNLLVPGGWAYVDNAGIKGLIVYNFNNTEFAAFDRACPHLTVSDACSQMIVESGIKMVCPCDNAEFNILTGGPLTTGITVSAREYRVTKIGNNISITNF